MKRKWVILRNLKDTIGTFDTIEEALYYLDEMSFYNRMLCALYPAEQNKYGEIKPILEEAFDLESYWFGNKDERVSSNSALI